MSRKQGFTMDRPQGVMQTDQIFDDTAPSANVLMAASLIGALWPSGAKTFRISMPYGMDEDLGGETEEVKQYYQFVTQRMAEYMDNPKAGLVTALEEYMLDQGAFGISGIMIEDQETNYEVPLAYRAVDAKALHIAEGQNGFVDTIYVEREYYMRQLVEKYGIDNISAIHRDLFLKGGDEAVGKKVRVLHAIEPRLDADPHGFGDKNFPYASIHIDIETEKIMKESGFPELPVAVTRFWKAMGEVYGRCPAMNALPSIFEANALGEAWSLAVEKTLDPSLLVLDDGTLGGGTIDTSPGSINVVSVSGRIAAGTTPIQPLFLVGDLKWTAARRTELGEIIKNHFYQDRLMDLNNEHRMQNPEVAIRNELRGQTLNTVYNRQYGELFVPLIETTFKKLQRRGLLGVMMGSPEEEALLSKGIYPRYIPQAVADRIKNKQEVYKIEFISPATRIMQSEELQGTDVLIQKAVLAAGVKPDVLDIIDWDWTLRRIQELGGARRETILSLEKLKKLRADKAAMQQALAEQEQKKMESESVRNMAGAAASAGLVQKSA